MDGKESVCVDFGWRFDDSTTVMTFAFLALNFRSDELRVQLCLICERWDLRISRGSRKCI